MYDILAHASNYATPTQGMRYAAEMAKAFDGSLTGIFVAETHHSAVFNRSWGRHPGDPRSLRANRSRGNRG